MCEGTAESYRMGWVLGVCKENRILIFGGGVEGKKLTRRPRRERGEGRWKVQAEARKREEETRGGASIRRFHRWAQMESRRKRREVACCAPSPSPSARALSPDGTAAQPVMILLWADFGKHKVQSLARKP